MDSVPRTRLGVGPVRDSHPDRLGSPDQPRVCTQYSASTQHTVQRKDVNSRSEGRSHVQENARLLVPHGAASQIGVFSGTYVIVQTLASAR